VQSDQQCNAFCYRVVTFVAGQQQLIQRVAPTYVQMLTLQYTAEQMIKEEAGESHMPLDLNVRSCRAAIADVYTS